MLRRVLRPAQVQSHSSSAVDGSAKHFNLAKFHTRPSADSVDESTLEIRPVFKANHRSIDEETSAFKNVPDASITKPQKIESVVSNTETPISSTAASIDLQEFSQKYPDKWQRILVAKQPELNVFGEKIGNLHRLELEQGVFGHKLHRLTNEPHDLGSASSSSALAGRSAGVEVKRTQRAPTIRSEGALSDKSASSYEPPLTSFGSMLNRKAEILVAAASSPAQINSESPSSTSTASPTTTLSPSTASSPHSGNQEMVTMVSVSSSVSMSRSKSDPLASESANSSSVNESSSTVASTIESSTKSWSEAELVPTSTAKFTTQTFNASDVLATQTERSTIAKVVKQ